MATRLDAALVAEPKDGPVTTDDADSKTVWAAEVVSVEKAIDGAGKVIDGLLVYGLKFTAQGEQPRFAQHRTADPDSVKVVAQRIIAAFKKADEVITKNPTGPIDLTPPAPPVVIPPTQDEIDRTKFLADLKKLQSLRRAIALELREKDSDYDALFALVKSEYKKEYDPYLPAIG